MSAHVERMLRQLREMEDEVVREAREQQHRWHYRLHRGRIWFDRKTRAGHRQLRLGIPAFVWQGSLLSMLTAPIIYSLIVPLVLLDLWVSLFQWVCFPVYGIARVRRREYFSIDRHKLAYLNAIEKVHCTFCSYANGLFAYVTEVAARTEQYWCPIKHGRAVASPHHRYHRFFDYGDALRYRNQLSAIRSELRDPAPYHRRTLPRRSHSVH